MLELHDDQLRLFGGGSGIRDRGALESAGAVPQASFDGAFLHEDLFAMAAPYAFHIAENQPFVDGNKRTALNAARRSCFWTSMGGSSRTLAAISTMRFSALQTAPSTRRILRSSSAILRNVRSRRIHSLCANAAELCIAADKGLA